jgi:ubiquinone/menaquinone biosynthesis C-methylase UbiE
MAEIHETQETQAHREVMERLWTRPLLDVLSGRLTRPAGSSVLVAEARCGLAPLVWANLLPEDTRVIALDPSRAMLDIARQRVEEQELMRRIFLVSQRVGAISYADDVFKASLCVHGVVTASQARDSLKELARVTQSGGQVVLACPLADSFPEFHDLFDEALRAHQLDDSLRRLEELPRSLISEAWLATQAREIGLQEVHIERVTWRVTFESGRAFLMSALLRETFFPQWIGLIRSSDREYVLRAVADAVDTYFHERTFSCEVSAACLIGTR